MGVFTVGFQTNFLYISLDSNLLIMAYTLTDPSRNPQVTLNIQQDGPVEFWTNISVIDESGRTTFHRALDNAGQIPLGDLNFLKNSTLNVIAGPKDPSVETGGNVTYDLLYDGAPTEPKTQQVLTIRNSPLHFFFTFCPRHPFC